MQLLAKFKTVLYMGFRATLNFRKFRVALNPPIKTLIMVIELSGVQFGLKSYA